jgi:hypothetical protein
VACVLCCSGSVRTRERGPGRLRVTGSHNERGMWCCGRMSGGQGEVGKCQAGSARGCVVLCWAPRVAQTMAGLLRPPFASVRVSI